MQYTFRALVMIELTSILLTSCGSRQSGTPAEKIEFPATEYLISSAKDTTLFGPQGTRIFIGSNTFQFADGSPAGDSVTIELKEFYKQSDIILADLSTRSGDKLLETGGMLHISATSQGKALEIKADKRIVVHFPRDINNVGDMQLFYADQTASEGPVTNWNVDTVSLVKRTLRLSSFAWWYPNNNDSTSYDFRPQHFVDTGYYWNPLDFYVRAYDFSESVKREVAARKNKNSYSTLTWWNDYGVECEMNISTEGRIKEPRINTRVSKSTRKEILEFLRKLPLLEPGKNKHGEIIERSGFLFIQAGEIIPLYQTDKEYIQSFNSKYARYEKQPIKNMDEAEFNFYVFSVSKLGWINCDQFVNEPETVNMIVQTPVTPGTKLKLAFPDINGVLMADVVNGQYVFSNVPKNRPATIIGIKNDEGNLQTVFQEITITDKPLEALAFTETTLAKLKTDLALLDTKVPAQYNQYDGQGL